MKLFKSVLRHRFSFLSRMTLLGLSFLLVTTAIAQQQSAQELLSQADEVLQQMSQITGLPIKGSLNKQVVNRADVEKYITQNMHEEMTPAQIHAQEALARVLGVVPRDFNLEKFVVGLLTEQAAGFYDPKRKTMYIADWVPPELQGMTLSHELTHALQDQNWDLDSYLHGAREDDDASAARQAVVEGYATAAMMQQATGGADPGELQLLAPLLEALTSSQVGGSAELSNAPYFFRAQLLFPYIQGMSFIQAGLQHGGWKGLDVLFEHPPESTQEIAEPEVYFNHQVFPKVELTRPPALELAGGLRFLTENSMGELGYSALLGQLISEDEAKALGPAWLADRYLLYERSGGNDYTLVARARWTSPEQAQAFFRDYHSILANKYSDLVTSKRSSPDEFIGSAASGAVLLLRKGDECAWAEGVPTAKTETMLAWLRAL
jgi:ABC-type transporter MlaC component